MVSTWLQRAGQHCKASEYQVRLRLGTRHVPQLRWSRISWQLFVRQHNHPAGMQSVYSVMRLLSAGVFNLTSDIIHRHGPCPTPSP